MRVRTERNLPLLCPPLLYIHHYLTLRAEFLEGNRDLIAACRAKQAFRFLSIIVKLAVSEIREGAEEGWEEEEASLLRLPSVMGGHFRS